MNFYSYDEIKNAADVQDVARNLLGLDVRDGRCAATWRGGTNPQSVALTAKEWFDHGSGTGGSVIDLAAAVLGDTFRGQEALGEYLRLTPSNIREIDRSKYAKLLSEGWTQAAKYDYHDEGGKVLFSVYRLEKGGEKTFLQRRADGRWGLGDTRLVPYHLPKIIKSPWVYIVEGEKCADVLDRAGFAATTSPGGAKKWRDEYKMIFQGKDVAILPDHDEPGLGHAVIIAHSLREHAKSIRVVITSTREKGDVYNYLFDEGHNVEDLVTLISSTPPMDTTSTDLDLAAAKEANRSPFRNFTLSKTVVNGKPKIEKVPRKMTDMVEECHQRFLGFPRRVGGALFDHDRDTKEIVYIQNPNTLFAWMSMKSGQVVEWARGDAFTTKSEFLSGLQAGAMRYSAVSTVPAWPKRDDVYYNHPALPPPSRGAEYWWRLVDMFSPATPENRVMVATILASPVLGMTVPRPLFIIESDQAGAGKTTLAEAVAALYGGTPSRLNREELRRNVGEVVKRLVSPEGRSQLVALLDNVTGLFASETLADLVTASSITGRPTYGTGEEVRPNNLTWIITANDANVDNDLAIRAYFVHLAKSECYSSSWRTILFSYLRNGRMQILSDLISLLSNHKAFETPPVTRTPEFEQSVLQAMCVDQDVYANVVKSLMESKANANVEEDWASSMEDALRHLIVEHHINPEIDSVWITTNVLQDALAGVLPQGPDRIVSVVRALAKQGHTKRIDSRIIIYPHRGDGRRRGVMWLNETGDRHTSWVIVKRGRKTEKQMV